MKVRLNGWYTRLTLVALGLGLVAGGIMRNEVAAVFTKASRICLECIGIG
ncbi:CD1871A family CXXC motif-containing protein [Peptococcus simiae]|uniref:CD1871A family CXXC motif-containing protein n=1 Tax=Peptococcus simiae TaxID=1643805 RepID=A0ABW9H036_9FIRM